MKPDDIGPRKRKNPFVDETGKNPFSDEADAEPMATEGQGVYAAPQTEGGKPYTPDDFVTTAPHRAGFLMTMGICGMGLAPTGFCCPVFALGGAILSILAFALGGADLRAMKLGAMDSAGQTSTRTAYLIGVVGLVLNLAMIVLSTVYGIVQLMGEL